MHGRGAVRAGRGDHVARRVVAQVEHLIGVWREGVHACAGARLPLPNAAIDTPGDDSVAAIAEVGAGDLQKGAALDNYVSSSSF